MMILMLTLLFACAGSDPMSEKSASELVECEGLDEEACEEAEGCSPIEGWRVHGEYDCENWGPKEYAGCRTRQLPEPEPCLDVESYVYPPGAPDECWAFGNSCTPDGWIECDENCWV